MMFSDIKDNSTMKEKAEMLDLARFFRHMGYNATLDDSEITLSYDRTHSHFMFGFNDLNRMRQFVVDAYDHFVANSETITHEELKEKGLSSMDWMMQNSPIPLEPCGDEEIDEAQCRFGMRRLLNRANLEREQQFVEAIRYRIKYDPAVQKTERETAEELLQYVNYHDGGYIEGYVAMKLVDYIKSNFGVEFKPEEKKDD